MRSNVFLTPMTPDGKPGEAMEIFFHEAPRQFMEPVPYFATRNGASIELEKERAALVASLPKLKGGARSKADHRIRVLDREIRTAFEIEEVERRNTERVRERQRQQVGANSPFARQTSTELNASTVSGAKVVGAKARLAASPTVRAYAAQGKKAVEVQGMFGPAIMVR